MPYVRTVVSNKMRGLLHYPFTQLYTSADADYVHGAAADSTYLHRISVNTGDGHIYYRRDNGSWSSLDSATPNPNGAIAAVNNQRVIVVYNRGTSIYFRESTDQGASFGAETLAVTAGGTVNGLAAAYKNNSGDLAIFWIEGANVRRIRRNSGTFGSATTWTKTANTLTAIAVVWNGDFNLVLTGTETTTLRPTLWSLVLGDGFSYTTDTWTAFFIQAQAESDEAITFQAPSVGLVYDTTRITFVEKFTGTPSYTRTYWTAIASAALFSPGNWEWLDPVPLNNSTNFGYAVCKGRNPQQVFLARPAEVLQAPTAGSTLDMSADLIEASIEERDGLTQRGTFVFDNSANQYAGPPAPIMLHRQLDVGLGYGAEYSSPPAHTIVGWDWRRDGGRSTFVLHTRGNDFWLELSRARTSIVETRTMALIARAAAARAGLDFIVSGASTRANNFNIEWVVNPDQNQLEILRALLEIQSDILISYGGGALQLSNPDAGDTADYTYGTDHATYHSRIAEETAHNAAEVLAAGVLGSAFDYTAMNSDKPSWDRRRSPHETGASDANANAAARLRRALLAKDLGYLITPPNCGLEIGDVVQFTDAAISGSPVNARVASIRTLYKRATAVFEQRTGLGGV